MNPFDKIIGYETIKKELERTASVLKDSGKYKRLGVSAPSGLMLYGNPGVGKSLMANCLIEASGLPVFICRKDQHDGDFIKKINEVFEKATEQSPAIVYPDDMDKFANGDEDFTDQEEYVTVQSCIDRSRGKDVFVLATANRLQVLPESLLRPGRFDKVIHVDVPDGKEAAEIIQYYVRRKECIAGIDVDSIAAIMAGYSCAKLETAINKAGIIAGFEGSDQITMDHLIKGCLDIVHKVSPEMILRHDSFDLTDVRSRSVRTAIHEAGHAVVAEILSPGSVGLACIYSAAWGTEGIVCYRSPNHDLAENRSERVVCGLAGGAAVELQFGIREFPEGDLRKASRIIINEVNDRASKGFFLLDPPSACGDRLYDQQNLTLGMELDECFMKAKRILASNRTCMLNVAAALLKKGVLAGSEIRKELFHEAL